MLVVGVSSLYTIKLLFVRCSSPSGLSTLTELRWDATTRFYAYAMLRPTLGRHHADHWLVATTSSSLHQHRRRTTERETVGRRRRERARKEGTRHKAQVFSEVPGLEKAPSRRGQKPRCGLVSDRVTLVVSEMHASVAYAAG